MNNLIFDRVVELCKQKGISQRKLQEEIGMSIGSLSKWKTSTPNATLLRKVADYFNVTTDYLEGKTPYMNQDHMLKCWQEKYGNSLSKADLILPDGTLIKFNYSKDEGIIVQNLNNENVDYVYIDIETRKIAETIATNKKLKDMFDILNKLPSAKIDAIYNVITAMSEGSM